MAPPDHAGAGDALPADRRHYRTASATVDRLYRERAICRSQGSAPCCPTPGIRSLVLVVRGVGILMLMCSARFQVTSRASSSFQWAWWIRGVGGDAVEFGQRRRCSAGTPTAASQDIRRRTTSRSASGGGGRAALPETSRGFPRDRLHRTAGLSAGTLVARVSAQQDRARDPETPAVGRADHGDAPHPGSRGGLTPL